MEWLKAFVFLHHKTSIKIYNNKNNNNAKIRFTIKLLLLLLLLELNGAIFLRQFTENSYFRWKEMQK